MPELIETLFPAHADCPTFVVNTGAEAVAITQATLPAMQGGGNKTVFDMRDNFIVLSYGITFPLSFQFYQKNSAPFIPILRGDFIAISDDAFLDNYFFNEFFRPRFPMETYENAADVFLDIQNKPANAFGRYLKTRNFKLHFGLLVPSETGVSMDSVPPTLNGKTFSIVPFLKILHNFPLVS
jgi:hypothetical protein